MTVLEYIVESTPKSIFGKIIPNPIFFKLFIFNKLQ